MSATTTTQSVERTAQVLDMDSARQMPVPSAGEVSSVLSAEINQQIATAKQFPRVLSQFMKDLRDGCTYDAEIARSCHYALPRAGKTISGPSIRMAEMVATTWGNCRVAARIVDETNNFIIAQGVFLDLQKNVAYAEDVTRRIINSKGQRFDIDMIGVTGAAARSIAMRNAIFRGVPRALWMPCYREAVRLIKGDVKTLKERRAEVLEFFHTHGVGAQQVYSTLGVGGIADITTDHLVTLGGFRTSIEDDGRDPEEIFAAAATKTVTQGPASAPKPPEAAGRGKEQAKESTNEKPAGATPALTFKTDEEAEGFAADYEDALTGAETVDALKAVVAQNAGAFAALGEYDPERAARITDMTESLREARAADEQAAAAKAAKQDARKGKDAGGGSQQARSPKQQPPASAENDDDDGRQGDDDGQGGLFAGNDGGAQQGDFVPPPIPLTGKPDWSTVAGEIIDVLEANPDEVVAIGIAYTTHLERMATESPSSLKLVKRAIAAAGAGD